VKATFFCVGENAKKYPEIISKILVEGHGIGNHTYNHIKGWKTKDLDYVKNAIKASAYIKSNLFRPPYGRITRNQGALLKAKGFRIIMWNLLSCDYLASLDKEKSLSALVEGSKSGSIIVFHDSEKAAENLYWILPRYLEALHTRGLNWSAL